MPPKSVGRNATSLGFGERVRTIRLQRGWSQEALAHEAGLSWTYVASIERGERNAGLSVIVALAAALDVPGGTLIDGLPASPH